MLRCFDNGGKVNYVDDRNRFAGFDTCQQCCESFGHGVYGLDGRKILPNVDNEWLSLSFADCPPIEDDGAELARLSGDDDLHCADRGGMVRFKLVNVCGVHKAWLVFYNEHNGWYSHTGEYNMSPATEFCL